MKKEISTTLTVAVLALAGFSGFARAASQGPSAEVTSQWLQARTDGAFVSNAERMTSWFPRLVIGKVASSDDKEVTWHLSKCHIFEWKDLRSIAVIGSRLGYSGYGKTGNDAAECRAATQMATSQDVKSRLENLSGGMALRSSAPADQLINAIKRMAELNGSQLVAEDLFK